MERKKERIYMKERRKYGRKKMLGGEERKGKGGEEGRREGREDMTGK